MEAWMRERLLAAMERNGGEFVDLDRETAIGLRFITRLDPHRGPYRLTRDQLNAIAPSEDTTPVRQRGSDFLILPRRYSA